jgi:hemolysin III
MTEMTVESKPRLRGVFHEWAFFASLGAAGLLIVLSGGAREAVASSVYVAALAALFGVSALYHRVTWTPSVRAWMRRLDHSTIFVFIAGTYTPFALLAISGTLGWIVLTVVWVGAVAGMLLSLAWIGAPKWIAAGVYLALGWVGVLVAPQLVSGAGVAAATLVAVGGILYTVGAIAYATKRPNRWPQTFGYHELFHVLVIAAATVQFVAVALVVVA